MAATTRPSSRPAKGRARVVRFDRTERWLHWVSAAVFLVLIATAAVLYIAPLSALVGRRNIVRNVHVVVGLLLPLPYLVARLGPWASGLRADSRRLARFDAQDSRWLRTLGRDRGVQVGKFHPLQKLNAAFTAGSIPVMLGTGAMMYWFSPFPLAWRTGATFVHDWVSLGLFATVSIHIAKALADREALGGMWHGRVTRRWARQHHPRWLAETAPSTGPAAPVTGDPRPPPEVRG